MAEFAGVDISKWNTGIDYKVLKNGGINDKQTEFAMIRFSYGTSRDGKFDEHYNGCKAAGIKVGAYHWLRAKNLTEARAEAKWLAEKLSGYRLDYPVALDFEDSSLLGLKLSKEKYTAIITTFMDILQKADYYVILYTNPNILENYLSESIRRKYDLWLAHWTDAPKQYGQKMWQYAALGTAYDVAKGYATKVGSVAGVQGPVDVNISYVDYAAKIKALGKNGNKTTYRVTGTKIVESSGLAMAQGQLKALGYDVTTEEI